MALPGLYRQKSLVYPAGRKPGFDPSHPLSTPGVVTTSVQFLMSAVLNTGNAKFLTLGNKTGAATTVSAVLDSVLGPCTSFTAAASHISLASVGTFGATGGTWGLIIRTPAAFPTTADIVWNDSSGGGWGLSCPSGTFELRSTGGSTSLSITLAVSTPYLLLVSNGPSHQAVVVKNLNTGAVTTHTGTSSLGGIGASNGTLELGNTQGTGSSYTGLMAAAMFNSAYFSLQQLIQVAYDPWSFWYPDPTFAVSQVFMQNAPPSGSTMGLWPSTLLLPFNNSPGRRGLINLQAFTAAASSAALSAASIMQLRAGASATGRAAMGAAAALQAKTGASTTGQAAVGIRSEIMLKTGVGGFSGAAPVGARSTLQLKTGVGGFSGKTTLSASSALQLKAGAAVAFITFLSARSTLMLKSGASAVGSAAMGARSVLMLKAGAGFSGAVGLTIRSALQLKSGATVAFFTFLSASSELMLKAGAATTGAAALGARSILQLKTGAGFSGAVSLGARSMLQLKTGASVAFLAFLSASSRMALRAGAAASGAAALGARASMALKSGASPSGVVGLGSRSLMAVKTAAGSVVSAAGASSAAAFMMLKSGAQMTVTGTARVVNEWIIRARRRGRR